ncbi:3'-5' exoribonuclease yham [Anaeramoeba ignava]|uniref:3'-5' exoribonuclease yham n=1 Tax=Anaeramoeba ignava TaxID=1746090 RepID=A0A9Q0L940_ANAIG|nr:3'-5' exoribonuclease yham [Anaeramoeba ignava]
MISKESIQTLFKAQLDQIKDAKLAEKVVEAWLLGCEQGGWKTIEDLEKMPFTLITDTKGINFIEHTIAVTEGAIGLAKAQLQSYKEMPYKIDMDRLIAGGILHDVGKLLEIEKVDQVYQKSRNGNCIRHPISGTVLAAQVGIPQEILNIIACHSKEGDGRPKVIEAVLVHQADFALFDPLTLLKENKLIL